MRKFNLLVCVLVLAAVFLTPSLFGQAPDPARAVIAPMDLVPAAALPEDGPDDIQ